jgi:hypothetical protein
MSGLEVMALVIAVMPVIATVLERYARGLKTIRGFQGSKKALQTVADHLDRQSNGFRNVVETLLGEGLGAEQVYKMLRSGDPTVWSDANVQAHISTALGTSTGTFNALCGAFSERLSAISNRVHQVRQEIMQRYPSDFHPRNMATVQDP